MKRSTRKIKATVSAHADKYYELAVDPGVPTTIPSSTVGLLRFNWKRQRYLWRIQLVYKFMIFFLLTICLATWIFYFFARRKRCTTYKRCGWFHNYECSSRRFDFVTLSVFAESWVFLAQALLAILETSLLNVFLHTTMREVTQAATSKAGRLGCLTKYVPWAVAVFHIFWLLSIGACLVFIGIGGCQKRFNANGLQAILNCRMYFSMCCSGDACGKGLLPKDVHQCNSVHFLSAYGFFKNPIPIEVASKICEHIEDLVPPDNGEFCSADQTSWECFGDDLDISDFGKWVTPARCSVMALTAEPHLYSLLSSRPVTKLFRFDTGL